ncbi:hydrogenase nickel incorporation protein HypB [Romboutsia sp.]|uniref:hydrogenase nickel incorporation protein HypB n=1 Tax=Romboutsia sp. TaxID=1965302 RepID=UPI003F3D0385
MKQIIIEKSIVKNNEELAKKNKDFFNNKKIFTINLLGSPGSGKTRVIEKIIGNIKKCYNMAVIEGDLYTAKDAMRIEKHNIDVIQLNTGGTSHLDASMIAISLQHLNTEKLDFLVIENVGSLVLPESYDLSEDMKIVVMSVTEGNDKPLKYPSMFKCSSAVILNKMDLIENTDFDINEFYRDVHTLNKDIKVFEVSCRDDSGIDEISDFLKEKIRNKKTY